MTAAYEANPNIVTQMGNQGHAMNGWRLAYEYIKADAIGQVQEFHTWANRPVWPQGGNRKKGSDPVPDYLNCDAWIGSAPVRPYLAPFEFVNEDGEQRKRPYYHPFNWRGVVDFGSGALGDMACHKTDGIYAIMNPGYAATAELNEEGVITNDPSINELAWRKPREGWGPMVQKI